MLELLNFHLLPYYLFQTYLNSFLLPLCFIDSDVNLLFYAVRALGQEISRPHFIEFSVGGTVSIFVLAKLK